MHVIWLGDCAVPPTGGLARYAETRCTLVLPAGWATELELVLMATEGRPAAATGEGELLPSEDSFATPTLLRLDSFRLLGGY